MIKRNEAFFDQVSEFYDSMINFNLAIENRKSALAKFVKPEYKYALDLGCGTGMDSIALASLGLNVMSIEQSEKMLNKAKLNSRLFSDKIQFIKKNLSKLKLPKNKFDIVISLGNTLANVDSKNLLKIFVEVYKSLKPRGMFLIQILNYKSILHSKQRLINTTEDEASIFIRFYDFDVHNLKFNVIKLSKKNVKDTQLLTTELYAHQPELIRKYLNKVGFKKNYFYADFNGNKFFKSKSKDLVLLSMC